MLSRCVCLLLALVSLAAFFGAVYLYLWPPIEEVGLVVEEPARVVNHVVAGREVEVEFCVHNRTAQMLRIVGGGGASGCPT